MGKLEVLAGHLRSLLAGAPALHAEIAANTGLSHLIDAESGLMHAYRDRAAFEADAMAWRIRRDQGIHYDTLEGEEFRARQPHVTSDYTFGVYVPEAGHCKNPGAYNAGIVANVESRGARRMAAKALNLTQSGGKVTGVETSQGHVSCDAVVIAAGARAKALAAQAGDKVSLETERGYHVTVEGSHNMPGPATPIMVGDRKVVITRLAHGVRCAGQVEIASVDAPADWRRAEIVRKHIAAMFPELDRSEEHTSELQSR